jgi:hypothetical protein
MRTVRPERSYNRAEIAFLSKNRRMNRRQLHGLFVRKFGRDDVTFFNLNDLLHRKGWQGAPIQTIEFSAAEIAFLRRRQAMKRADLHALFIQKFSRADVTYFNIKEICRRHGLRTGRDRNTKPLGSERVSKDGFLKIKISHVGGRFHHRSYVLKHRWLWERAYGPVPDGYKLKCRDGNKLNTDTSNWECVRNGVLRRLINRGYEAAPPELKPTIMAVAKLEDSIRRKSRNERKGGSKGP